MVPPGAEALLRDVIPLAPSLAVVAKSSGAGKTTLLTSLLDLYPESLDHVYIRGQHETFDFADSVALEKSLLCVNEISPHLPAYLWGKRVGETFGLVERGARLVATAHADSAGDFLGMLLRPPLAVSGTAVARLDLILAIGVETGGLGHLAEITAVLPGDAHGAVTLRRAWSREAPTWVDGGVRDALVSKMRSSRQRDRL